MDGCCNHGLCTKKAAPGQQNCAEHLDRVPSPKSEEYATGFFHGRCGVLPGPEATAEYKRGWEDGQEWGETHVEGWPAWAKRCRIQLAGPTFCKYEDCDKTESDGLDEHGMCEDHRS
jgi:hypothetical protein